jgi:magnesium transporter
MPFRTRSFRRLSFLIVNIFLNVIAASVIALFTDTLEAVIALAVFLPIISDMGGNSGSQAIGVSIREMSLGLIKTRDYGIVLWKEFTVGMLNGFVLGIIIAFVGALYVSLTGMITDPVTAALFGFIVGCSMMLNTVLSVLVGGTMPLFLKRIGIDPALASVSILTTITDIGGFFLVLGMAALLLA